MALAHELLARARSNIVMARRALRLIKAIVVIVADGYRNKSRVNQNQEEAPSGKARLHTIMTMKAIAMPVEPKLIDQLESRPW